MISGVYANSPVYTLDLRELPDSSINLETMAKHSDGHLVLNGEKYELTSDVKIVSNVPLEFTGELFVRQWNFTVESPAIEFRDFSLKSFSDFKEESLDYASGSVHFLSNNKDSAGDEIPLSVSGKLSVVLRGQKKENGRIGETKGV